ncbi:hypothetical protein, partial [Acinetobacter baumannii]|uniref:hypothetical protein n=1 Tax=Acinetobacter baumannii TaxID=470 RepID=UPI002277960E
MALPKLYFNTPPCASLRILTPTASGATTSFKFFAFQIDITVWMRVRSGFHYQIANHILQVVIIFIRLRL